MVTEVLEAPEFPNRRFDDNEVSRIIRDLMEDFQARDDRLRLRDALLFRRTTDEHHTGQYVPPPFNNSRSIIKHATGILIDRAQHLTSKGSENPPNIQVNVISNDEPASSKLKRAKEQEDAFNALYWEADRVYDTPLQHQVTFSAVTKGVGWYLTYENSLGWKIPNRAYYVTLSEEEIEKLGGVEAITDVFPGQGKEFQYAESLSLWERRKQDAMRENAADGHSLFIIEALHPGCVYYRRDTRGISIAAVIEEVPMWDMVNEFGIVEDEHGNIVIGPDRGGPTQQRTTGIHQTWIRVRLFTRDEVYYYVSRHQGGKPVGAGTVVFHTTHDMGEVPLFACAAYRTDSPNPEEEFTPLLEGAYAMIPGYNQILTLLSNAAVFNATPRYVIVRNDGTPVIDPETSEPMIFETDNIAGIDPQYAAIIDAGGGQFQQLKIENVNDLITLVEVYGRALDQTLPPEAALGASGASEPAWGTRLKQAAANIKVTPVVGNHARGVLGMARLWARIIRHRRQKVVVYSKPKRRGRARNVRAEISLDPQHVTLDMRVDQSSHDAQERIVMTQVGMEMLEANRIGPIEFYEDWKGSDDPYGELRDAMAWQVARFIWETESIPRIINRVRGRLTEPTPNEMQVQAEGLNPRPDMLPGEPAAKAGIRQPGIEQGIGLQSLPDLQGQNATPVRGELPV